MTVREQYTPGPAGVHGHWLGDFSPTGWEAAFASPDDPMAVSIPGNYTP
jgi:hypothetical protein